jgi:hypothetical protein
MMKRVQAAGKSFPTSAHYAISLFLILPTKKINAKSVVKSFQTKKMNNQKKRLSMYVGRMDANNHVAAAAKDQCQCVPSVNVTLKPMKMGQSKILAKKRAAPMKRAATRNAENINDMSQKKKAEMTLTLMTTTPRKKPRKEKRNKVGMAANGVDSLSIPTFELMTSPSSYQKKDDLITTEEVADSNVANMEQIMSSSDAMLISTHSKITGIKGI